MMIKFSKFRRLLYIVFTILMLFSAVGAAFSVATPDSIAVFCGGNPQNEIGTPFVTLDDVPVTSQAVQGRSTAMLFGVIPLKTVDINVIENVKLYPGGIPFGVKFTCDGILVVGVSEIDGDGGNINPGKKAGIEAGDVINEVNGSVPNGAEDLISAAEAAGGNALTLKITRGGEVKSMEIFPVKSKSEGKFKLGLWVRDSTAGIGTVTFINPENNTFAGLGHGICDPDTGTLLPMKSGSVIDVSINGIKKGESGMPGELQGYFNSSKTGALIGNTSNGVYGAFASVPGNIPCSPLPIGLKGTVKVGPATIYCTTDNNSTGEYAIEIEAVNRPEESEKNFVVRITDPTLLEMTGGIVQGMSGSPIIQNGHLIGAVTHVMVNDPTRGYGIFIENMLSGMPEIYG